MRRERVQSSSLSSVGYDPSRRVLEVEFRDSGHIYQYFSVPAAIFEELMKADSKGTFFNKEVKEEGFTYKKIF